MSGETQDEQPVTPVIAHPLEPLSAEEIAATSVILIRERSVSDAVRFVSIELHEPAKQTVLGLTDGQTVDRETFVVLHDRQNRITIEAIVSLTHQKVCSWREVSDVQPMFGRDELAGCETLIYADPQFEQAMLRRGVTDLSSVSIDLWSAGNTGPQDDPAQGRLVRALFFVQYGRYDNYYARPVEGLMVTVDLDRGKVVEVVDHDVVPLPERPGNYIPELITGQIEGYAGNFPAFERLRQDLRPIEIVQPEGPSFTVHGWAVSWQKWRLRIGYSRREGLILHQVGYEDGGRLRPILYRASPSELYVYYGDPNPMHRIKNIFDEGEWGIGPLLNSLVSGCDCLGHIRYFDVVVNDDDGNPRTVSNAICMHEEDAGVGWKHTDGFLGHMETRRNRRLVLSCFLTANNYDYGFFWYFYLDGMIEFEVKLTGIVSTGAFLPTGKLPACGTVLAPGLYAPNHQHFFNVRLDMCVDGQRNSVYEVDSVALSSGPDNPGANAWATRSRLLAGESQAQRLISPLTGRYWLVINPSVCNALGQPVGYKLVPGENILPLAQKGSQIHRRAGFAHRHLWVTAYDPAERYAAGDYPNQRPDDSGLPVYVRADRSLDDADVVLWYTFGAHHVPRPEDWPVKPTSADLGRTGRSCPRPGSPAPSPTARPSDRHPAHPAGLAPPLDHQTLDSRPPDCWPPISSPPAPSRCADSTSSVATPASGRGPRRIER